MAYNHLWVARSHLLLGPVPALRSAKNQHSGNPAFTWIGRNPYASRSPSAAPNYTAKSLRKLRDMQAKFVRTTLPKIISTPRSLKEMKREIDNASRKAEHQIRLAASVAQNKLGPSTLQGRKSEPGRLLTRRTEDTVFEVMKAAEEAKAAAGYGSEARGR